MQLGALSEYKGKGKKSKDSRGKGKEKGKDGKNESKRGAETQPKGGVSASDKDKRCYYCQKLGHAKAECRQRLRDLAAAEGRPAGAMLADESATLMTTRAEGVTSSYC